jgi:hypothetical protein
MSSITVFEPLTLDEENERRHLERQIEKAFYQAGLALQALRDKKLYRSTHSSFEEYCHDRFGFTRRSAYYLIDAVEIIDNLKKCEPLVHIMPTNERQCRPLKSLKPEQQREAWSLALTVAKSKVPSGKIVEDIVNQIKTGNALTTQTKIKNKNSIFSSNRNNYQAEPQREFVSLKNPTIGQRVRISNKHPLFPQELVTITQLPNNRSAIVEFSNHTRELIDLKDLERQRIVDKNGRVSRPSEGINYIQGVGVEWYVRVDEETWKKLNTYAEKIGTATLGGAIARLLASKLDIAEN